MGFKTFLRWHIWQMEFPRLIIHLWPTAHCTLQTAHYTLHLDMHMQMYLYLYISYYTQHTICLYCLLHIYDLTHCKHPKISWVALKININTCNIYSHPLNFTGFPVRCTSASVVLKIPHLHISVANIYTRDLFILCLQDYHRTMVAPIKTRSTIFPDDS